MHEQHGRLIGQTKGGGRAMPIIANCGCSCSSEWCGQTGQCICLQPSGLFGSGHPLGTFSQEQHGRVFGQTISISMAMGCSCSSEWCGLQTGQRPINAQLAGLFGSGHPLGTFLHEQHGRVAGQLGGMAISIIGSGCSSEWCGGQTGQWPTNLQPSGLFGTGHPSGTFLQEQHGRVAGQLGGMAISIIGCGCSCSSVWCGGQTGQWPTRLQPSGLFGSGHPSGTFLQEQHGRVVGQVVLGLTADSPSSILMSSMQMCGQTNAHLSNLQWSGL